MPSTEDLDAQMSATTGAALVLVTIALALVTAIVWWKTPELHVDVDRTRAVVHMELWGEYPSDIRSVEIERDGLSTPIWKVVAYGDMFQIHSMPVRVGDNPGNIDPYWGTSRQIVPSSASTFRLDASHPYRVRICPASPLGLCRSAGFVLAAQ
jgi:hypothetical protein